MFNAARERERIVKGIRLFFESSGAKGVVMGLSGGVDSSLTAYLLKEALGAEKITLLIMPEKGVTKKSSIDDALLVANNLQINYKIVEIAPFVKKFGKLPWKQNKVAMANVKARIRMLLLYNYANSNNCLVAGTSNKTELLLGYFTKYGDGAADFLPIASLFKSEVRQLAEEVGIPKNIIEKKASAELWNGQTDEEEIGLSYEKLDSILRDIVDEKKTKMEIISKGILSEEIKLVLSRLKAFRHKREMPCII